MIKNSNHSKLFFLNNRFFISVLLQIGSIFLSISFWSYPLTNGIVVYIAVQLSEFVRTDSVNCKCGINVKSTTANKENFCDLLERKKYPNIWKVASSFRVYFLFNIFM